MPGDAAKRDHPTSTTRARQLRRTKTVPERNLWSRLRNRQLGNLKFRRQHPVQGYVLDFYCAERHIAVELDGPSHSTDDVYDAERTDTLAAEGIKIVRYTNRELEANIESVFADLREKCLIRHL